MSKPIIKLPEPSLKPPENLMKLGADIKKTILPGQDNKQKDKQNDEKQKQDKKRKNAKKKADAYLKAEKKEPYFQYLLNNITAQEITPKKCNPVKIYEKIVRDHFLLMEYSKYKNICQDPYQISFRATFILLELLKYCYKNKKTQITSETASILNSLDEINKDKTDDLSDEAFESRMTIMRNINILLENTGKGKSVSIKTVSFNSKKVKIGLQNVISSNYAYLTKLAGVESEKLEELLEEYVMLNNIILRNEFQTF